MNGNLKLAIAVAGGMLMFLLLAACSTEPSPAPVPPPTNTPVATAIPVPTATTAPEVTAPSPSPLPVDPTPTRTPTAATAPTPTPTLEPTPAGERIDWSPCGLSENGSVLECGSVAVPADYRDPEAGSIRIAVNVHRATSPDERIGYLFMNPGGPGVSGLELPYGAASGAFTDEIVERFDIVGFDPRGVGLSDKLVAAFDQAGIDFSELVGGGSEPEFACGGLGEQLALLGSIDGDIDTPEEIAIGEAAANLCIQSMGPVGGLLHSEYVANDMDEIRRALGAEQISYLGFSYGSELGVWYATLFPESVRAMAVDGARNPFPSDQEEDEEEEDEEDEVSPYAVRLEEALTACADPECPIYNDGDPVGYLRQAIPKLDLVRAAAGNPEAGHMGVIMTTLNEQDWPDLWQGLFELNENDDPSLLLEYAMKNSSIRAFGASFNKHVKCLDQWVLDPEGQQDGFPQLSDGALRQDDGALRQDDGIVADATVEELLALMFVAVPRVCPFYHQFAPEPLGEAFYGGGVPILVVGNHDDPATSFRDSEEVATEVISNGYLVETSHYKHVVYPQNQCVNDHVHRALIDGVYPSERRVICAREDTVASNAGAGAYCRGRRADRLEPVRRFRVRIRNSSRGLPGPGGWQHQNRGQRAPGHCAGPECTVLRTFRWEVRI